MAAVSAQRLSSCAGVGGNAQGSQLPPMQAQGHEFVPVAVFNQEGGAVVAVDWLPVGKVVAVQELKGELRINPASEFTEPGTRWLKARGKAPREIELTSGRQLPGTSVFVVRFAGIDSRDAAEALVGQTLMVPFVEAIVPEVHLNDGWLLLTPPPGLLELG